jgi:GT2 family glycosyltransferase
MKPVSIVIASWNKRDDLRGCPESIRQAHPTLAGEEVAVVDKRSGDDSPKMVEQDYSEVTLMRVDADLDFAKGNNLPMKYARGLHFKLVTSDASVHPGALQTLSRYLGDHSGVCLVGPPMTGGDGLFQRGSRHSPGLLNMHCREFALERMIRGRAPSAAAKCRAHDTTRCTERKKCVAVASGMNTGFQPRDAADPPDRKKAR